MDETIELLREASAMGYAGQLSIIDKLLDERACTAANLAFGYRSLQEAGTSFALAFFDLPYRVLLPDYKWLAVPSTYGHPYICFGPLPDARYQGNGRSDSRTQAIVSFQLWGRRREFYGDYLSAISGPHGLGGQIVSSQQSWLPNQSPLTAGTYEAELTSRIYGETLKVLKSLIPIYTVAARDPKSYVPQKLDAFFMMVSTGRVVVVKPPETIEPPLPAPTVEIDYTANLKRLRASILSARPPSVYEKQLLEAEKQAANGAPNVAVVYTVMILDWLANELIQDGIVRTVDLSLKHTGRIATLVRERLWESDNPNSKFRTQVRTPEKFEKYLPAIGLDLPDKLLLQLNEVIRLRNRIIHKAQTASIERAAADHAIDVGMRVIEFCMRRRIELATKKPGPEGVAVPAGPA